MNQTHCNHKTAEKHFYNTWANDTKNQSSSASRLWNAMKISLHEKVPSGISMESAKKMFDPKLSTSLTNCVSSGLGFRDSVIKLWYSSSTNRTRREEIRKAFDLTESQLDDVVRWLRSSRFMK